MIYLLKGDYWECKQWVNGISNLSTYTIFTKEKKGNKYADDLDDDADKEPATTLIEEPTTTDDTTDEADMETVEEKLNISDKDHDRVWQEALEACRSSSLFGMEGMLFGDTPSQDMVVLFHSNKLPEIPLKTIGKSKKARPILNYFTGIEKDLIIWVDTENEIKLGNFEKYIKKSFRVQDLEECYPGKITPDFSQEYLSKNFNCYDDLLGCQQNQINVVHKLGMEKYEKKTRVFSFLKDHVPSFNNKDFLQYETTFQNPHAAKKVYNEKGSPPIYLPKDGRGFYLCDNLPYKADTAELMSFVKVLTFNGRNDDIGMDTIRDILPEQANRNLIDRISKYLIQMRYREAQAKLRIAIDQLGLRITLGLLAKITRLNGLCWLMRDQDLETIQTLVGDKKKSPSNEGHKDMIIKKLRIKGEYFYTDNEPVPRHKINENPTKTKLFTPNDQHVKRVILRTYLANFKQDTSFLFSDMT